MPFINTSGAGVLIIDAEVARAWTGFFVRADADDDNVDLQTDDGVGWRIHDLFDFRNPVTDYDRLCARHQHQASAAVLINALNGRAFASISDGTDSFGWWPAAGVFTANTSAEPAQDVVARADFRRLGVIDVPSGRIWLMNPCLHGAEPEPNDDRLLIEVEAGRYAVEVSAHEENALLLRLTRERDG